MGGFISVWQGGLVPVVIGGVVIRPDVWTRLPAGGDDLVLPPGVPVSIDWSGGRTPGLCSCGDPVADEDGPGLGNQYGACGSCI